MDKTLIQLVIRDAILDRESYLDAVCNVPDYIVQTERDLARLRALAERYRAPRVTPTPEERRLLALAGEWAFLWRDSYRDANAHSDPKEAAKAAIEARQARRVTAEFGGPRRDPTQGARLVTLQEIRDKNLGTRISLDYVDGREIRNFSENGASLGRVETDTDGTVRAYLPEGSAVNLPFEDAWAAQDWLLGRFSKNAIFARDEDDDEETAPTP